MDEKVSAENPETVLASEIAISARTTPSPKYPLPIIVAGGLNPETVCIAVDQGISWLVWVSRRGMARRI